MSYDYDFLLRTLVILSFFVAPAIFVCLYMIRDANIRLAQAHIAVGAFHEETLKQASMAKRTQDALEKALSCIEDVEGVIMAFGDDELMKQANEVFESYIASLERMIKEDENIG